MKILQLRPDTAKLTNSSLKVRRIIPAWMMSKSRWGETWDMLRTETGTEQALYHCYGCRGCDYHLQWPYGWENMGTFALRSRRRKFTPTIWPWAGKVASWNSSKISFLPQVLWENCKEPGDKIWWKIGTFLIFRERDKLKPTLRSPFVCVCVWNFS